MPKNGKEGIFNEKEPKVPPSVALTFQLKPEDRHNGIGSEIYYLHPMYRGGENWNNLY
jgi:hypothetical protein